MISSGIWFLFGAISYMFLEKLINTGRAIYILQESLDSSLRMLNGADAAMGEAIKFKKENDKDSKGVEEVEEIREVWRALSIIRVINSVPEKYRTILRFEDWAQAMKLIR